MPAMERMTGAPGGRMIWILLVTALLVGGVAAMAVTANAWKREFRVLHVRTEGNGIVADSDIVRMASVPRNSRLFDLDLSMVRGRVEQNPFMKSVAVERDLPDGLTITVEERKPVAALVAERILYLDAEGYVLPPVRTGNIADLPVITGEAGGTDSAPGRRVRSRRLREALEILTTAQRVGDDLYHMISEVHCSPDSTFVLFTTESGVPVAFGRGDVAAKLVKFDGFWKQVALQRGAAQLKTVDIRFADQVVVRWDEPRGGAAQ
jgi:cell division protein FtsQ